MKGLLREWHIEERVPEKAKWVYKNFRHEENRSFRKKQLLGSLD